MKRVFFLIMFLFHASHAFGQFIDTKWKVMDFLGEAWFADTKNIIGKTQDFYEGWYIDTVDSGGSRVYAKIEDPDSNDANVKGYIASSKRLSVKTWYSDSALTSGNEVTPTISNNTVFTLKSRAAYSSVTQLKLDDK